MDLLVDLRVGFAQDVPPLAVAENDVLHAQVAEHRGADFAGKCPIGLVVDILSAQGDFRTLDRLADRLEVARRRADGQIDSAELLRLAGHRLRQGHGGLAVQVHLPIAGNKLASHLDTPQLKSK